jgi:hypothetical protein
MAADGLLLPDGALAVGAEIARGANAVVHAATLYGVSVCAKVTTRTAPMSTLGGSLWR